MTLHAVERLRRDLDAIVRAAIAAVEPGRLVVGAFERAALVDERERVHFIAAGKAAAGMAGGALQVLGSRIVSGLIAGPMPMDASPNASVKTIAGGHPVPTANSVHAGRYAVSLAASVKPGERLICLLSGGASALMAAPAAGLSLEDKVATTARLLAEGADIRSLNTVRKHLSDVKGGSLALHSATGCHTLAISDVIGDDVSVIGSGPGVPDDSRFDDAMAVLRRCGGLNAFPSAVVDRLRSGAHGQLPETLKPSDPRARFATGEVIGNRTLAMRGAASAAERLGYHAIQLEEPTIGEARDAAAVYFRRVGAITQSLAGSTCVISSGETTVRVKGDGRGGRNQEFALASVEQLSALGGAVILASVGTDGIDGPTPAAGAMVNGASSERARRLHLDSEAFLRRNDSYGFFERLGDLIVTGPTGTNVGDMQVLLLDR
jgi:glycerate-2-kinase